MNVLITGVAGLLGSRLADWIIKNTEHNVVGIDDLSGGYEENIPDEIPYLKFNLIDNESVEKVFKDNKIDIVYHFAAYAAEGLSPFIRKYNYENNLIASINLINASIKYNVDRFIFASSMAVYGNKYDPPFSEDLTPSPIDPYGIAKFSVEQDLKVAYEQHGLKYTIVRPHNFYGRNQNIWDKYRNVLGIWMYQFLNGKPMTIFGTGMQTRAFSYIDDTLEPMWNSAIKEKASKQIINLGGIESISIINANLILKKIIGDKTQTLFLEKRHEVEHAIPTFQKSIDILNFKHKTNLDKGLYEMWEWARIQPKRNQFIWPSFEINDKLYSFWKNSNNK